MELRLTTSDSVFQQELLREAPSTELAAQTGPSESGFGETLYTVLVATGVVALPTSVVAGLIAAWLVKAYDRRMAQAGADDDVVGAEAGDQTDTISLSDRDVKRIAKQLKALLDADNA